METKIREYRVSNMSNWSAFCFVLAAPIMLFLSIKIGVQGRSALSFIVALGASAGIMVFLFRYLQQKSLVIVSKDGIKISYLHRPFFDGSDDMYVVWDDIASYKFQHFNGVVFSLYLKNGRRFRASKGGIGDSTSILQMAEHIIAIINERSAKHDSRPETKIKRRKTIAEGNLGLALAIVSMLLIVAMLIGIFYFPEQHNAGDVMRGMAGIAACFAFIFHVYKLRKRAEQNEEQA